MLECVTLIIGVGAYAHLNKIPCAGTEAKLVYQAVIEHLAPKLSPILRHDQVGARYSDDRYIVAKADITSLGEAFRFFKKNLLNNSGKCYALFYYSGHGVSDGARHYLFGNDAEPSYADGLCFEDEVLKPMRECAVAGLAVLNCCRKTGSDIRLPPGSMPPQPYGRAGGHQAAAGATRDCGPVAGLGGVYMCWAASPMEAALVESPFASKVVEHLFNPRLSVLKATGIVFDLVEATGQQRPCGQIYGTIDKALTRPLARWMHLDDPFDFRSCSLVEAPFSATTIKWHETVKAAIEADKRQREEAERGCPEVVTPCTPSIPAFAAGSCNPTNSATIAGGLQPHEHPQMAHWLDEMAASARTGPQGTPAAAVLEPELCKQEDTAGVSAAERRPYLEAAAAATSAWWQPGGTAWWQPEEEATVGKVGGWGKQEGPEEADVVAEREWREEAAKAARAKAAAAAAAAARGEATAAPAGLAVGQLVAIKVVSVAEAKAAMDGYGGWSEEMAAMIGHVGFVESVEVDGNLRVKIANGSGSMLWRSSLIMPVVLTTKIMVKRVAASEAINVMAQEWAYGMETCLGKIGTITNVDSDNILRIQMDDGSGHYRWSPQLLCFPGAAESRRLALVPDTRVLINNVSVDKAKASMRGHGGWSDSMAGCLGKAGKVVCVNKDGDLLITMLESKDTKLWDPALVIALEVGARVGIRPLSVNECKKLQKGHYGWYDAMEPSRGKAGTITDIDNDYDPMVQIDDGSSHRRWNPALLGPPMATSFLPDMRVLINNVSVDKAKASMRGHGGWSDSMASCLGKVGKVVSVDTYGNVAVKMLNMDVTELWTPALVIPLTVGTQVVIRQVSADEAKKMRGKAQCLGKIGTVTHIDKDYDMKVEMDDGSGHHRWSPELLEACWQQEGEEEEEGVIPTADKLLALGHQQRYDDIKACTASISNVQPLLSHLLPGSDIRRQSGAARVLLNLAADNDANRSIIAQAGAISPLVQLLSSQDTGVQQQAAEALGSIAAGHEANRACIAQAGAIPPLVGLLSSPEAPVQLQAGRSLESLATLRANRSALVQAGAIPPLLQLLSSQDSRVQECSAGALAHLSDPNDGNRGAVATLGAIQRLVRLLDSNDAGVQANSARVLSNLISDNNPNKLVLVTAGSLPALVRILSTKDVEAKKQAANVLNLLASGDDTLKAAIAHAGAIPLLVHLLGANDTELLEQACMALDHLVSVHANKKAVKQCGGRAALRGLLDSPSFTVRETAKKTLDRTSWWSM